jgi:hypothetical protein
MLFGLLGLLACTGRTDGGDTAVDTAPVEGVTGYDVEFTTDPTPAVAGEQATFTLRVLDQLGRPIEDLQQAHARMVHTLFISKDLVSFQHLHHEDFASLTADDLRTATYHFPVTFPMAGDYRVVFDFAHEDQYLTQDSWLTVAGAPAQSTELALDYSTPRVVDDVTVALTWDVEPYAGYDSEWTVHVTDTATGADITDLVQWLGADAHAAVVSADLAYASHTHAWFPGMDGTPPGHDMPHLYDGPDLPFHFVFPTAGAYKMWVQFARAGAPDTPYVADFAFDVLP